MPPAQVMSARLVVLLPRRRMALAGPRQGHTHVDCRHRFHAVNSDGGIAGACPKQLSVAARRIIKRHIVLNMVGGFDAELGTSCPKQDPRPARSLAQDRNSPDPKNRARIAKLVGRQEVFRPGSGQRNGFAVRISFKGLAPPGAMIQFVFFSVKDN